MTPVIYSWAVYKNVKPAELYKLFMNSASHTAATGSPAKISRKVGGKWSAFEGMIFGKNLALVPNRMIVQSWRSSAWKAEYPDSILVVQFKKSASGGAAVELAHVGVPKYDHRGVTQGWVEYYWKPWKEYIRSQKRGK